MGVQLHYINSTGTERACEFETNIKEILLIGRDIKNIDLSPLSQCSNLQYLHLADNKLEHIDLSPLSSTSLVTLHLRRNRLTKLDVSPLLVLGSVNLNIDSDVKKTAWIDLNSIYSRRNSVIYARPSLITSWEFLHRVAARCLSDERVQHDFLYALGLGYLGFIGSSLFEDILAIPPKTPIESAREQIRAIALQRVIKQIDTRGFTTGLDLSKAAIHEEIASRTKEILQYRKREMEDVILYTSEKYPLQSIDRGFPMNHTLYCTHYGYEIMSALDVGVEWSASDIELIKRTFADLGFTLTLRDADGISWSQKSMIGDFEKVIVFFALFNAGKLDSPRRMLYF